VRWQAKRDTALDSMSDKLQFVDASKESGTAENDKLKFIGHKKRRRRCGSAGALK